MKCYLFELVIGDVFRFDGLETKYTYKGNYSECGETYYKYTSNGNIFTARDGKSIVIPI